MAAIVRSYSRTKAAARPQAEHSRNGCGRLRQNAGTTQARPEGGQPPGPTFGLLGGATIRSLRSIISGMPRPASPMTGKPYDMASSVAFPTVQHAGNDRDVCRRKPFTDILLKPQKRAGTESRRRVAPFRLDRRRCSRGLRRRSANRRGRSGSAATSPRLRANPRHPCER